MSDFTDSNKLHTCLGDFWYSVYQEAEQIGTYVSSITFNREQWDTQLKDMKDLLSRHKLNPFESLKVKPLYVTKSEMLKASEVYPVHDGTYKYDGRIYFDVPVGVKLRIPIREDIKHIGLLSPKLLDGVKYVADDIIDGTLALPFNPFELDEFTQYPVYDADGRVVDYKVTIWAFDVKIDKEDMYYQYGYIFNIRFPSSKNYNNLINVLYDSLINGPTEASLRLYVSACTGIPVALHKGEVVVAINCDIITTDKEVYEVSKGDKITVNVGDVLDIGDTMTTGLTFYRPDEIDESVKAISLDKHYIGLCVNDLVFENTDIPVKITSENGYTRLDLPVKGRREDVKLFNDTVFDNGIKKNTQVDDIIAEKVLRSFTS